MEVPDYSGEPQEQDPNAIRRLGLLAAEMAQLVLKEEDLEEQLKECKRELKNYQENLVPELMSEIGLTELVTAGGLRVEMKEEVRAAFPKEGDERRPIAFAYLERTGNDGIVKNVVGVSLGRDSAAAAKAIAEAISSVVSALKISASVEQTLSIHHQTLVKFLKDQLRDGAEVPMEAFGAFVQRFARIKRGK